MKEVQLKDAKANLSAVVDEAIAGEPTTITRHGKPKAVIVSHAEWLRLSNVPSFARLLMSAPDGIEAVERDQSPPRDVDL